MTQAMRPIGFFEAVALAMTRSLDYRGRSSRLEFACWLGLAPLVCGAGIGLIYIQEVDAGTGVSIAATAAGCFLLLAVPGLPLAVRRLHDLGRNAAWLLVPVVAGIAALMAFVYGLFGNASVVFPAVMLTCLALVLAMLAAGCLLPSQPGANRYGPQPLNEVPA